MLFGSEGMRKLAKSRVAVFGIGGVGGYVVEALARSGVGTIDITDNDTVCASNLNRQIIALHSTLGKYKTDAAEERIRDICPQTAINKHTCFFLPENADSFDFSVYDYVIDAIDTVTGKIEIILRSQAAGTPVISAMGAGNKLDPTALRVSDIYKTKVCPLARVMRRELKKRGVKKLKVVYSEEEAITPLISAESENPLRRSIPGSNAFVPSAMGLIIAAEVVKDIVYDNKNNSE